MSDREKKTFPFNYANEVFKNPFQKEATIMKIAILFMADKNLPLIRCIMVKLESCFEYEKNTWLIER